MGFYRETYAVIYVLTDLDSDIFYVGCTIKPLLLRLSMHLADARSYRAWANKTKNEKIRSLNYQVLIKEVDRILVTGRTGYQLNGGGRELERHWMLKYYHMGYSLTNGLELKRALKRYNPVKS